jgi:hypothetical protein
MPEADSTTGTGRVLTEDSAASVSSAGAAWRISARGLTPSTWRGACGLIGTACGLTSAMAAGRNRSRPPGCGRSGGAPGRVDPDALHPGQPRRHPGHAHGPRVARCAAAPHGVGRSRPPRGRARPSATLWPGGHMTAGALHTRLAGAAGARRTAALRRRASTPRHRERGAERCGVPSRSGEGTPPLAPPCPSPSPGLPAVVQRRGADRRWPTGQRCRTACASHVDVRRSGSRRVARSASSAVSRRPPRLRQGLIAHSYGNRVCGAVVMGGESARAFGVTQWHTGIILTYYNY